MSCTLNERRTIYGGQHALRREFSRWTLPEDGINKDNECKTMPKDSRRRLSNRITLFLQGRSQTEPACRTNANAGQRRTTPKDKSPGQDGSERQPDGRTTSCRMMTKGQFAPSVLLAEQPMTGEPRLAHEGASLQISRKRVIVAQVTEIQRAANVRAVAGYAVPPAYTMTCLRGASQASL